MPKKIIPVYPASKVVTPSAVKVNTWSTPILDQRQRPLRDLRISVTDRCNFRCTYCMPKELFTADHPYLKHDEVLSFEEIFRIAQIAVELGVEKIRLTGGEPLLRRDLEVLIELLSRLQTTKGKPLDISLTTNGVLLHKKIDALIAAGLKRITISLDALDDQVFKNINDMNISAEKVLEAIDLAHQKGLYPIKVNVVVQKGINEDQIIPLAEKFRHSPVILRFIEYMDVGNVNAWSQQDVVSGQDIHDRIHAVFPLEPVDKNYTGEVAERWRYVDGGGEIGLITSITQTFCHSCNRARLSTDGKLFLCLFASEGYDVRSLLRNGASHAQIQEALIAIWQQRNDRYSEIRHATERKQKIEMSYIGG